MPTYPDANRWSNTHHVEIETTNPNIALDVVIGLRPRIDSMVQQTQVFDANLQKELLLEFGQDSKTKSQEYF